MTHHASNLFERLARADEQRAAAQLEAAAARNTPNDAVQRVLDALDGRWQVKTYGADRWRAQCPAHDGKDLNLSISRGDQGVLVYCHSHQCSEKDIAAALGLEDHQLFDRDGRAVYDYGGARIIRTRDGVKGKIVRPERAGSLPEIRPLWTPPGVSQPISESDTVYLTEGEKAADALARLGAPCVATWPGGTGGVRKVDLTPLAGKSVIIVPDNDEAGQKCAYTLAQRLTESGAATIAVQRVPAGLNDPADLWVQGGGLDDLSAAEPVTTVAGYTSSLYADVAEIFKNGPIEPPVPEYGLRTDNIGLLYKGHVNSIVGDPESGKTWIALTAAADVLFDKGSVLLVDLDHNGAGPTLSRLRAMGVSVDTLSNTGRFRYAAPEESTELLDVVNDARTWQPDYVLIDSIGELLPLFGASSNDSDEFTNVHAQAIKPFAAAGACVVTIDHQAKGRDSREYGATGTVAKKRAISGVMLRVTIEQPFTPGQGGTAELTIVKDRHGGLRARSGPGREPLAGRFELTEISGALNWSIRAPEAGERPRTKSLIPHAEKIEDDVATLDVLNPPPASVRDVAKRCEWGKDRARVALQEWRSQHQMDLPDTG